MHPRASVFLTELRGTESTRSLSTRLGYAADVVAEWEAGRTWPTAAEVFRVCGARRIDVVAGLRRFEPNAVAAFGSGSDAEIAAWLRTVCGSVDVRRVAARTGRPTATVRRWLGGQVRPTFPDLLTLLDATGDRAEAFLQALLPRLAPSPVDDDQRAEHDRESARRRACKGFSQVSQALDQARQARARRTPPPAPARRTPSPPASPPARPVPVSVEDEPTEEDEPTVELFGSAPPRPPTSDDPVWRAVISADYRTLGRHRPGWLEARTGLDADTVQHALDALQAAGRLHFADDRWQPTGPVAQLPETRPAPADETPVQRLARQRGGQITLSLSADDLDRVRALRRRTRDELQAIAATSRREVLALVRVDG